MTASTSPTPTTPNSPTRAARRRVIRRGAVHAASTVAPTRPTHAARAPDPTTATARPAAAATATARRTWDLPRSAATPSATGSNSAAAAPRNDEFPNEPVSRSPPAPNGPGSKPNASAAATAPIPRAAATSPARTTVSSDRHRATIGPAVVVPAAAPERSSGGGDPIVRPTRKATANRTHVVQPSIRSGVPVQAWRPSTPNSAPTPRRTSSAAQARPVDRSTATRPDASTRAAATRTSTDPVSQRIGPNGYHPAGSTTTHCAATSTATVRAAPPRTRRMGRAR